MRLLGIRLREQGTHDSFCAYYAAAMLLCTLRPEFDEEFDAVHVKRDPLFRNLPRRGTLEHTVADWLTTGVKFAPLAKSLDAACGGSTRFRATREGFNARALVRLRRTVDEGLPCVLGWESRELGNHTVVVAGYDGTDWLRVLDPTGKMDLLEWSQLARVATAPADVIWCTTHDGVRPDKMTVERNAADVMLRSRVDRWSPKSESWDVLVTRRQRRR